MNAAVINVLGQPPLYLDFADPVAEDGEIVVKMLAAGLHPVVKARASGQHYSVKAEVPAIPGIDGVGLLSGKPVYCYAARPSFGTMAERTVVYSQACFPLPDGLSPVVAAAIANPGMSAWLSLKTRAALKPGESVLILGATGVAGKLAIQSARHLGARRIIAAGRNLAAIESLDVDATVGLAEPEVAIRDAFSSEIANGGIDVVIDYLWGRPTELLLEALAKGFTPEATQRTRLVEVGESAGKTISLPGDVLRSVNLTLSGSGFGSVPIRDIMSAIPELFSLAAAGILRVAVEPVPLSDVEQAWDRDEKGKRIVFTMD
jgi:NADPH:quinone reductase-like Zn-dependent oxidoreductase